MRRSLRTIAFAAALLPLLSALHPGTCCSPLGALSAQAQNLGARVVSGHVLDEKGALVIGATVFLKNLKSKSIRSFNTVDDGRFRFAEVNMMYDFELWAEKDGKKTEVKTVSSWDSRKTFETELKLK